MDGSIIPLMREALKARFPAAPINARGPAILSTLVFFAVSAMGIILRLITGAEQLFTVALLIACGLSLFVYFLAKKLFRSDSGGPLIQAALSSYDPLLGRLHGWGFEAAAQLSSSILKNTFALSNTNPRVFSAIDENFHFLVSRLHQLGQAKLLIGNERELKKHCDKLSAAFKNGVLDKESNDGVRIELAALELRLEKLEQIGECAVLVTRCLKTLHDVAKPAWEGKNADESDGLVRELVRLRHEQTEEVNSEFAKIGL